MKCLLSIYEIIFVERNHVLSRKDGHFTLFSGSYKKIKVKEKKMLITRDLP
jgi:hypothetical protein